MLFDKNSDIESQKPQQSQPSAPKSQEKDQLSVISEVADSYQGSESLASGA